MQGASITSSSCRTTSITASITSGHSGDGINLNFSSRPCSSPERVAFVSGSPRELAVERAKVSPSRKAGIAKNACAVAHTPSPFLFIFHQSRQRDAILLNSVEMRRVYSLFGLSLCQKKETSSRLGGGLTQPEQVQLAPQLQVLPPAPEHPQSPMLMVWVGLVVVWLVA